MKKIVILVLLSLLNFSFLTADGLYGKLRTDGILSAESSSVGAATGERYRFIDDARLPETDSTDARTRSYLYAGNMPVSVTENGQTLYIVTDVRGSVRTLTDRYGVVTARSDYDAFGVLQKADAVAMCGLGYAGKPFDSTTQLYNYGFRDYSPAVGRFTTLDPIRYGSNWYAYVNNDPVNYVDLLGLKDVIAEDLVMLPNGKIRDKTSGLKDRTVIEVLRSPDDNGNNGKFYKSTMNVTVGDIVLSSVAVQSTADWPGYFKDTLETGEYKGVLYARSGHYETPILISGNDTFIHPNVWTTPEYKDDPKNGTWNQPFSQNCQITSLDDFIEQTETLEKAGFNYDYKDTVMVIISDQKKGK